MIDLTWMSLATRLAFRLHLQPLQQMPDMTWDVQVLLSHRDFPMQKHHEVCVFHGCFVNSVERPRGTFVIDGAARRRHSILVKRQPIKYFYFKLSPLPLLD